ncbi:hypothetical protein H0H81_000229 [Sphagnurus paluster]|uniref:Uncharacterized protein n=1 Tax=Sphagnurus paluster TaxID=117069 RepID=A0A9P7KM55_9AGAR|nr:hypothetical protein H0H81_000229 [Sphagnurus paluster]
MPLNAFISGPTAGGAMSTPRAVNAEFWNSICPRSERKIISSVNQPDGIEGDVLMDWWVTRLEGIDERCVEIDSEKKTMFDYILFGDTRILSLWPGLSKSPILKDFKWSSLVQSTIDSNLAVIHPDAPSSTSTSSSSSTTLNGLIAVHLRRGDFKGHCKYLVKWHAEYMGFNRFPSMLDTFDSSSERPPEMHRQYYMQHCMPEVEEIMERLRAVRMVNPGLNRVYALTNGKKDWVVGLKRALLRDGWVDVKSSLDLKMDSAQRHVSMAVDMAIAEQAEVFLGNGVCFVRLLRATFGLMSSLQFSSLTSNVVTLRMAKGLPTSSNRLL